MIYRVRKWPAFQHYTKRNPIWIKLYSNLLEDRDFLVLSPDQRSVLMLAWLVATKDPLRQGWIPSPQGLRGRVTAVLDGHGVTRPVAEITYVGLIPNWIEEFPDTFRRERGGEPAPMPAPDEPEQPHRAEVAPPVIDQTLPSGVPAVPFCPECGPPHNLRRQPARRFGNDTSWAPSWFCDNQRKSYPLTDERIFNKLSPAAQMSVTEDLRAYQREKKPTTLGNDDALEALKK